MNGYFQLVNAEGQTAVCLYPPVGDGIPIDMNEVVDYLNFNGVRFSIPSLYSAAKKLKSEPVEVILSKSQTPPIDEVCRVRVARDGMSAIIRFYPPSTDGSSLKKKDIVSEIEHRGIMKGLLSDVMEDVLSNREYCRDYEIARGEDTKAGQDGALEFYFEENAFLKPDLLPDGSVDLRHLFRSNLCEKDSILARIIPPAAPVNGYTVRGEEFPGQPGREKKLKAGKNVEFNPDDGSLKALTQGKVKLEKDRVFVLPLIKNPSPDPSTGVIDFEGCIIIEGDIPTGTVIKAGGDVLISGSVYAASIESSGDVIICGNVDGRGKTAIRAKGSVFAASVTHSAVAAGSSIYVDFVLHSNIKAADKIFAKGPRGLISGGSTSSRNGINVKVLGNDEGNTTIVETGADPSLKEEIGELETAIKERERVMEEAFPVLSDATSRLSKGESLTPLQLQGLKELHALYNSKKKEQKRDRARLNELEEKLSLSRSARVDVGLCIYPDTCVIIGSGREDIKERKGPGAFVREREEVKFLEGE